MGDELLKHVLGAQWDQVDRKSGIDYFKSQCPAGLGTMKLGASSSGDRERGLPSHDMCIRNPY